MTFAFQLRSGVPVREVSNSLNCILLIVLSLLFFTGCSSSSNSSAPEEECSAIEFDDQRDTDGDGLLDLCDSDDDNDGFVDGIDPEPLNSDIPGDYSTPEAILDQDVIRNAIMEAEAQGVTIPVHTGSNPPDLNGYFTSEPGSTVFIASDNGDNVGGFRNGAESRYEVSSDLKIETAVVNFYDSNPTSYSLSTGSLLRGSGEFYTRFSRSRVTCTLDGSNFSVLFVGISSGRVEQGTGSRVDKKRLSVSVETTGELTQDCERLFAGGAEYVGGWSASEGSLSKKVSPDDLIYMCVDEGGGYAPTESWIRGNGEECSCSVAYSVECNN